MKSHKKNTNDKYKTDINWYLKNYLNKKPCTAKIGGRKAKTKYYVTISEYEKMIKLIPESCPTYCEHPICRKRELWRLALEFLISTGCREGELSKLDVKDLNRKNHNGYFYDCKWESDRPFTLHPDYS